MSTVKVKNKYIKSPISYMGNKWDLLPSIVPLFPDSKDVSLFIDLFGGSGVVSLNAPYDKIIYNEFNKNIARLFNEITSRDPEDIINHIKNRIEEFGLHSEYTKGDKELRYKFKPNYLEFRKFLNKREHRSEFHSDLFDNVLDLYTITFFSFSRQIRLNQKGEFNMPIGNDFFSEEVHSETIRKAFNARKGKSIDVIDIDAFTLLNNIKYNSYNKDYFIYLDPPYSNTTAVYNEQRAYGGWTEEHDLKLFKELDELTKLGVKWALSNTFIHKGKENTHTKEWAQKYNIYYLKDKQYSAFGKGNANTLEVLITNYKK